MKQAILLLLLASMVTINAATPYERNKKRGDRDVAVVGKDVPQDASGKPSSVIRDRIEATTVERADKYKETQVRRMERELILQEIFDTDILMQPITRIIRAIDTIGVTPEYITTILFPHNMTILEAQASFETALLERKHNLLRFRPSRNVFASGNIVITLTDGNKNYEMTIIVNRYFQKDCHVDKNEYICKKMRKRWPEAKDTKSYAYAFNNLSIYYRYINAKILDPLDTIAEYEKLKKKPLSIPQDGGYDVFVYRGVSYKIIRDDTHGDIYYRAHQYRVVVGG